MQKITKVVLFSLIIACFTIAPLTGFAITTTDDDEEADDSFTRNATLDTESTTAAESEESSADSDLISPSSDSGTFASTEKFKDAKTVKTGQKTTGGEVTAAKEIFYNLGKVNPGFQLEVAGVGFSGTKDSEKINYLEFTLYDSEGAMLSQHQNLADGDKQVTVYYYPGLETQETIPQNVYLSISASSDLKDKIKSYEFTPTLNDLTDADSGRDAGETISAGPVMVEDGSYKQSYLGVNRCGTDKYCSTDEADTFKYHAGENTEVSIGIVPSETLGVKISMMDSSGSVIASKTAAAEGTEISIGAVSEKERDLYFTVTPLVSSKVKFGSYSIKVESSQSEAAVVESESEDAEPSLLSRIFSSRLIIYLGIAVVVVVVIIIVLFRMPKSGGGTSKRKQEKAEIVRKALRDKDEVVMPDPDIVQQGRSIKQDFDAVKKAGPRKNKGGGIGPQVGRQPHDAKPNKPKSSIDLEMKPGSSGREDAGPKDIDI